MYVNNPWVTASFISFLVFAALTGRAVGMITAKHGVRLVRRLGYRGRHRGEVTSVWLTSIRLPRPGRG